MRKSEMIDISVPVKEGMPHWPTEGVVHIERSADMDLGSEANVTHISMSAHTGTHVDAPLHFFSEGTSIDALPMNALLGPARVLEITHPRVISLEELQSMAIGPGERVLLKTRNSQEPWFEKPFHRDFVYLSEEAARHLVECRIRTVGIDYLSVGAYEEGGETHRLLLGAGICIIEGLFLGEAEAGEYDLVCLPLLLAGADGAPARALLGPRRPEQR